MFAILSYVTGHLLQAAGNWLELGWWSIQGGWPSDWVRTGRRELLTKMQIAQLEERVRTDLGLVDVKIGPEITSRSWQAIFKSIQVFVHSKGGGDRVYLFNGIYGLSRGIATAALVSAVMVFISKGWSEWQTIAVCLCGTVLGLHRMHTFGIHFAREVFLEFLTLSCLQSVNS